MNIGDFIIDFDGMCCIVTNMTNTSIEIYHLKKRAEGINHKQWYSNKDFEKRFKFGLKGYLDFINNSNSDQIIHYFKTKDIILNESCLHR